MRNGQLPFAADLAPSTDGSPWTDELPDAQLLQQFVRGRSERAFEALIRRHGPLVLGVCRRLLRHAQDAEDAFQATFLVLVRKAASLKRPELLAGWLYGVAHRTAQHARARAARSRRREREAAMPEARDDAPPLAQELRQMLDEELASLPERYRAPLVLCHLESKTHQEAARLLGWPVGSMSYRLARGCELLRERLTSRKRALAAVLPAVVLPDPLEAGVLPPLLAHATLQAALALLAPKATATGLVSASVKELMDATLSSLAPSRRSRLLSLLLSLVLLLGLGSILYGALQQPPDYPDSGPSCPPKAKATMPATSRR